jgi:hypothetical protein
MDLAAGFRLVAAGLLCAITVLVMALSYGRYGFLGVVGALTLTEWAALSLSMSASLLADRRSVPNVDDVHAAASRKLASGLAAQDGSINAVGPPAGVT